MQNFRPNIPILGKFWGKIKIVITHNFLLSEICNYLSENNVTFRSANFFLTHDAAGLSCTTN